jgi:serine/threonine protein kinase/Tol biopolymer transport system component
MTGNQAVDSLIGRVFKGYKVTRFIARGGMGLVFEGTQESLDRSVAIKFLYPHLSDDDQFRERFEREAHAIARLDHPNIVRVLDFGTEGQMHFMILDYIDGVTLRDHLIRVQTDGLSLRTETVANIVQQVGSALTYAHERGYVHRDVKPGNIMLQKNGRVFLTDFGVVKDVGAMSGTMTGAVIGTPEYMAPEQANGANVGPPADLYALAVVTYEMLVGRVPFQSPTPVAVLTKHLHEPPPLPSTIAPWYGPEVDAVFLRALAKNPNERYSTATEFSQELVAALHAPRGSQQFPPGYVASGIPTMMTPPPTSHSMQTPATQPPSGVVHPVTGAPMSGVAQPYQPGGMTPPPGGTGPVTAAPSSGGIPPSGVYPPAGATPLPGESGRGRVPIIGAILIALLLLGAGAFYVLTRDDSDDDGEQAGAGGVTATSAVVADATETSAGLATQIIAVPTEAAETPTAEEVAESTASSEATGGDPTPTGEAATATEVVPAGPPPLIVFSSHRGDVHDSQIYVMSIDGGDQRQITFSRGHSWGPRISLDGSRLFFSSVAPGEHQSHDASGGGTTGTGNHDIYVTDLLGTTALDVAVENITNITAGRLTWDNGWAWSPDGSEITYTTDLNGNWDIYSMAPDGSADRRLTDHEAQDGWPSWTPDGQQIVFSSDRTGNWELFIMNADGSNVRQLTNRPDTTDLFPEVSPDGTLVVFSSQVESVNEGEIYVMPIEGGEPTRLTSTAALNNMPSWCPSGEQIVYTSDRDGNENVYIMSADGSAQTRLTDDPGEDTTPYCTAIAPGAP